jgi:hypothetical protein
MAQINTSTYEINGATITKSTASMSWRLVYGNSKAYSLFLSSGTTETVYFLECYTTEEECLSRCEELSLDMSNLIEPEE